MKKWISLLVALLVPCVSLAEGVYVPSFNEFMNTFFAGITGIDQKLAWEIEEECKGEGEWKNHELNYVYADYKKPKLTIKEGNNYLKSIKVTIDSEYFEAAKYEFKEIILLAARAILPHENDTFFDEFFETIHFDYTMDSPAGYITMYTNCDVYLISLNKSSGERSCEISLSLYQPE